MGFERGLIVPVNVTGGRLASAEFETGVRPPGVSAARTQTASPVINWNKRPAVSLRCMISSYVTDCEFYDRMEHDA